MGSSLVGAHSVLDNSIRTWGWGSVLELTGAPGDGALLRISKKEMVDTQSGQVLGLDLDPRLTPRPRSAGRPGTLSRVVFVKQPWVWKRYSGLGSPLCCVRVWRTSVTKVLKACLVGIPCQFKDSHYIVYMVCVYVELAHTHTYPCHYIFICTKLELHQTGLGRNQKSSPQSFTTHQRGGEQLYWGEKVPLREG